MQQRFYFALFQATQLLGGAYYLPEVKKLRKIGACNIVPYIKSLKLRKYPYKVTIKFFVFNDADFITITIITAYILKLINTHGGLQSCDYRVIKNVEITTQKIISEDNEGCEIQIESVKD